MTLENCCGGDGGGGGSLFELVWLAKTADYTVLSTDLNTGALCIAADATAGQITITIPPGLGSATESPLVEVLKVDLTNNPVLISDGVTPLDAITTPASADGQVGGWRAVYANGTALRSTGVG